jgi:hypothetical protein
LVFVAQDDGVRRPNAESGDEDVDGVAICSEYHAPAGFVRDGDGQRGRRVAAIDRAVDRSRFRGFVIDADDAA